MDIREKVYNLIEEQDGADYDEKQELAQALSAADSNMLIQDLDRFYKGWFDTQQIKEYTEERARLEYIQETCFEVACKALALQGDPAVIPYFLKYVPVDEYDGSTVSMEDYNVQHLLDCISDKDYYGESYIPVLLAHLHELVPDKMVEAGRFLYKMILEDIVDFFETHPLLKNLHLPDIKNFEEILNYSLKNALYYAKKSSLENFDKIQVRIAMPIMNINLDDEPSVQIAYVRQEFLKLHASD